MTAPWWIEACGWASTVLITVHMLPQMVKVIKDGHAEGLSLWMLRMWLWAEIVCVPYALHYKTWAILAIIVSSIVQAVIFIHYKKHPREDA